VWAASNRFETVGRVEHRSGRRRSHDKKFASSFQGSSRAHNCKPKPSPWTAAARRPGRVSPARLSPRGGVSVHVWLRYGLRGGSSITDHDAFDRKSGRNEDCERRQGRLQRQAMPLEGACPGDYTKHVRNTSRPIVHVAVLPDRRENRTG